MWDCEKGDCLNIAESIQTCPMCGAAKPVPDAGEPTTEPATNNKKGTSKDADS
jgi:hypothetical protein